MDNVTIWIAPQDIRAVHTFSITRKTQIGHAEVNADHWGYMHKVWYQVQNGHLICIEVEWARQVTLLQHFHGIGLE
jgi:hypothetical protein